MSEAIAKLPDVELEEAHTPSDNEIKSIQALARTQYALQQEIADLEAKLKVAKERLRTCSEADLPTLMVELGVTGLSLDNGWKLDLDTKVYASITKEKNDEANTWLEKNKHGDIIKRVFEIKFGKDDEAWAKKFERDLKARKKPLQYAVKRAVHPQTLQAWVREALVSGLTLPEDLFGVFRKRVAILTPPKKPEAP